MEFVQPKHCPIIKVYLQKLLNELFECRNDYTQKYCQCILQSKRHYSILNASPLGHEGCLTPIFWCPIYLMISIEPITKRICFLSANIIQYLIHERSWKGVMNTSVIQFLEIYIDPYLILLLIFLNYYEAYPIRLLHRSIIHTTSILSNSK